MLQPLRSQHRFASRSRQGGPSRRADFRRVCDFRRLWRARRIASVKLPELEGDSSMRKIVFGAVCAAALLVQAPASARDLTAVLSDVQGSVLVGTEEGFREVSGTTNLAAGDRVVVAADSQAVLSYGPGCSFAVPP